MNVFNKVTLASLKKNRTRTVVTIIGIMLSATMICASTTFVASMQNFVLRYTIYKTGDWHGAVYDAAYKDYEDIGGSGKVASATYALKSTVQSFLAKRDVNHAAGNKGE